MKDANQIAQEAARREGSAGFRESLQPPRPVGLRDDAPKPKRGTLTVWQDVHRMQNSEPWLIQCRDVTVDLSAPGMIIARDERSDAEIFCVVPGWYINFVPNRDEGE